MVAYDHERQKQENAAVSVNLLVWSSARELNYFGLKLAFCFYSFMFLLNGRELAILSMHQNENWLNVQSVILVGHFLIHRLSQSAKNLHQKYAKRRDRFIHQHYWEKDELCLGYYAGVLRVIEHVLSAECHGAWNICNNRFAMVYFLSIPDSIALATVSLILNLVYS